MVRTPSRTAAIAGTIATLVVIGGADFLTGHEILLSTFYLVPVAMAAWMVGPRFALVISFLSLGAWLVGDFAAGAVYPHAFVAAWNSAIILAFYVVVGSLTHRLRATQRDLEERVRMRTIALTEEIAERERLEREILEAGEQERRRIGRDLHDSLGQLLTGTALAGEVLHEKLAARESEDAGDASRIVSLVEEAIELTRGLARGLDPVEMEGGGLAQGLRELAAKTSTLLGTRCEYRGDETVVIEDSIAATHLYRIAQEAIHNAVKHSRAARIAVGLEQVDDRLRLTVRDDGVGIPDPLPLRAGMGLRIMARRAEMMSGRLEVRRSAPRGTLVTCEVPNP
jgi:signal transduction histidine kinase